MNKELIKKYKAEFDHWLNGGELLYAYIDGTFSWKNMNAIDKNIYPVYTRNPFQISEHHIIIINDEYVEFRKALAEGKTIQRRNAYGYEWKDSGKQDMLNYSADNLRIKPKEPKFKVGDWVIHNGEYKQVTKVVNGLIDCLDKQPAVIMKNESLELWQPKIGEWCIMYDTEENPNANSITLQKWEGKGKWTPIPFIGQLPPYIKDSDES